jgi:16S rRNA (cytidine1402-2'-O)-methyltransferase
MARPGRLWLVSTPIGNLGDITRRAVEVLAAADLLVAEDTRRLRGLLSHLGITHKPVRALHAHSADSDIAPILESLAAGQSVAYTTDAGTPGVSDPGRRLVVAAAEAGFDVQTAPGPSAVTAAVALSGFVDGPFLFLGFLPRRGGERSERLNQIQTSTEPVVLFEAPSRAAETLSDLAERMPERHAYVGRELTKLHEESLRGPLARLAEPREWRGELVLVIAPAPPQPADAEAALPKLLEVALAVAIGAGGSPSHVARELAAAAGLPRSPVYQRALELQRELHPKPGP